jgi:hypothetical protein
MASQVSPGVIIRERDLTNTTIVNSQALRAAYAGAFQKGPVETPVAINSQKELLDTFGGPVDGNAEDWFVASEFLNYGGRLVVSRAIGANAEVAESAGSEVSAANEGSWGNDLAVVAVDRGFDQKIVLASDPAVTTNGTTLNFVGGKTAKLYNYNSATNTGYIVGSTIVAGDDVDIPDTGVAATGTITAGGGAQAERDPGTYTYVDPVKGATVVLVVADADGAGPGTDGGVVTLTSVTGGSGYSTGNTIVIPGTEFGVGTASPANDVTVTIQTVVNDTINVVSVEDWYRTSSVQVGSFSIKLNSIGPRPGTSAQGADLGFSGDEFHVAVISKSTGVVLETFQYLSKLQGGKSPEGLNTYYRTSINQGSPNIQLAENPFTIVTNSGTDWTDGSDDNVESVAAGALAIIGSEVLSLTGGDDDGYEYSNDALEIFRSYDATDIDFILMGGSKADENDTLAKAQTAVSIATERKDCVAFVSSHKGNQLGAGDVPLAVGAQKTNILNFFQNLPSTSYAVFDSGYKYLYDRFNDVYRYVPCNGDVAGLCVATSAQLADWYSPAGLSRGSLRNAIKLAYNPSQADRDDLYSERINPIVSLRGSGITLFGDKTALSSPSAFDRINVRRLFLNIERRVDTLAQGVLFSQNDSITRSGFSSAVSSYLSEIRADRGLTDFIVVCDDSNNTPSVIDRNEFVADIYLQPTRSINFITITLTATRTGVSFQEITGT